jgi:hypothetical protein
VTLSQEKKKEQKRAGGVTQGVGPELNPSTAVKRKKESKSSFVGS